MGLFGRQRKMQGCDPVEISEKQGVRYLHLGGHAVQSAMRLRDPWALELEYTRAMMMCLVFNPDAREFGLVGLGGGSIAKFVHRSLPEARMTAVEINPQVIDAARGYFSLPVDDARLEVRCGDGAAYVRERSEDLDVLMVDGYDASRIVEDLASLDFYSACRSALRPGGVAIFNLWGSDRHFDTYFQRIGTVFEDHTLLLPAEKKGNIQVFAFRPPLPEFGIRVLGERARAAEGLYGLEFSRFLDRMRSVNANDAGRFL